MAVAKVTRDFIEFETKFHKERDSKIADKKKALETDFNAAVEKLKNDSITKKNDAIATRDALTDTSEAAKKKADAKLAASVKKIDDKLEADTKKAATSRDDKLKKFIEALDKTLVTKRNKRDADLLIAEKKDAEKAVKDEKKEAEKAKKAEEAKKAKAEKKEAAKPATKPAAKPAKMKMTLPESFAAKDPVPTVITESNIKELRDFINDISNKSPADREAILDKFSDIIIEAVGGSKAVEMIKKLSTPNMLKSVHFDSVLIHISKIGIDYLSTDHTDVSRKIRISAGIEDLRKTYDAFMKDGA